MKTVKVIQGDITRMHVDAIVNAANEGLLGGGGVDGAIHRAAGPELLQACRQFPEHNGIRCPTGEARLTPGFRLPARYVIHTVGPIWRGGDHHEDEKLARCYHNSLDLARQHGVETMAFPAISCGIYGYPIDEAAAIALRETRTYTKAHPEIRRVHLVCFGNDVFQAYLNAAQ